MSKNFIPELWSTGIMEQYKSVLEMHTRSYGERLLRAAAKGEDWTKIKREENIHEEHTFDAVGIMVAALDSNVLAVINSR